MDDPKAEARLAAIRAALDELAATVAALKAREFVHLLQFAYDLAGISDRDAAGAGAAAAATLAGGGWLDEAVSGRTGRIPYAGELVNTGRLPRARAALDTLAASDPFGLLKDLARQVARLAEEAGEGATRDRLREALGGPREDLDVMGQGLRQLRRAMDSLLPDGLPEGHPLRPIRARLDSLLAPLGGGRLPRREPDISGHFTFREALTRRGWCYEASGRLGIPGKVRTHRDADSQRDVAGHTGDDAGHLIGNQFGAPGDLRNLTRQNRWMNQFIHRGTWYAREQSWARQLRAGYGIRVRVTDVFARGDDELPSRRPAAAADRPYLREVTWEELSPDGGAWVGRNDPLERGEVLYPNWTTPMSRAAADGPDSPGRPPRGRPGRRG